MKAKKLFTARVIHNSKPRKKKGSKKAINGTPLEDIALDIELPFVPAPGTMLRVTPKGEFLRVAGVAVDAGNPYSVILFTEEPDPTLLHSFATMRRAGWHQASAEELKTP